MQRNPHEVAKLLKRRERDGRRSNPNIGKRHAPHAARQSTGSRGKTGERKDGSSRRCEQPITVKFQPGKTVAARIAGIQSYYDRAARLAQIGA